MVMNTTVRHAVLLAAGAFTVAWTPAPPTSVEPAPHRAPAPDLPDYVLEALTPFRAPPDSAEVAMLLERWRTDGGLRVARERIIGARLLRRAGQMAPALDLLGELPDAGPSAALARLERARVGLELGDGRLSVRRASDAWRSACRALADLPPEEARTLREALWSDLGFLATPDEREAWSELDDASACAWIEALIEERAFRMAITPDERLALHYRRLATVRREFYLDRPRFYVGMTRWHGRQGGEWTDDRGLVYLRMGRPDETQSCGTVYRREGEPAEGDLLATCWIYHRPEGYRLYYFSTRDKVTLELHGGRDYYLQESLGPRAHPSDPYFQRYVKHADVPRSLVRHLTMFHMSADDLDAGLDRVEDQAYRHQMRVATRRFADEALIEIPDVPRVTGMKMLWEALRFQNPADGSWQVWIVASVPAGQLHAARGADTWAYEARARLVSRHADGLRYDSTSNRAVADAPLPAESGLPLRTFSVARPGPLPITLAVFDGIRPGAGAWAQDTVAVPRILPMPTVSDIAVAQSAGGAWTRDGETFLRVSPDHVTGEDGQIHVYFEVYGVRRTADYEVEVRLTKDRPAEEVFELDPSEVPFRLGFTSTMPYERIGRHALRLDLSDTPPGEYDLAVRVRDVDTGTRALPSVTPIVVWERPDGATRPEDLPRGFRSN